MKKQQPFTPSISNDEHLKRVDETYSTNVLPFLEGNRAAYEKYLQNKAALTLSPTQKANVECDPPA